MIKEKQKIVCLTFDIEDWFQVENLREACPVQVWDTCESRVVKNTQKILGLLRKYNIKATFFVLGWIAERYPQLVKEIYHEGHEIASHGYGHIINYNLTKKELYDDIKKSKMILESIIGDKVIGYRAPNFSIDEKLVDVLIELGFLYDSSLHPFRMNRRYGRLEISGRSENGIFYIKDKLIEISMPVIKYKNFEISVAGGGYFRLLPFPLYIFLVNSYLKNRDILVQYFHPWEFDPDQPRVKGLCLSNRFRHYVGLKRTFLKLDKFLKYALKKGMYFKRVFDVISQFKMG